MVVDMGTHMLRMVPGIHRIMQLLAPGLEERARALPPLSSTYATPGKPWIALSMPVACRKSAVWQWQEGCLARNSQSSPRLSWSCPQAGHAHDYRWTFYSSWMTNNRSKGYSHNSGCVQGTLMLQGQQCVRSWVDCHLAPSCQWYLWFSAQLTGLQPSR